MNLFTVVKNLVENAVRYTPEGGYVDLRLYRNQDQVIIDIEDSGPGITEDKRIRVFDTFYRLDGTGETGSGLGLSIVQVTVSRLGGKVALHSATHYPSGVRVTVSLPH
ncbi:sensor histidine kinase [Yersinia intermedia]|uniref:sensor histidine kinase n=1 Tax=Yersinia intermedia TaxID=631 RepID=UPI002243377C|nr:ATP-binding protein [Yersinia intermedia]MCW8114231.1 ATP-binding protein [Yersinia intermedia]MDA5519000.1 ATP-binding protein [Yersinia intermedia]